MSDARTDSTEAPAAVRGDAAPAAATDGAPSALDIVFCVDCTGSMGAYIAAAQENINRIIDQLVAHEKCDLRFGLVAYRDHPPQDSTYVTRVFPFSTARRTIKNNVAWMSADGGGDGPEAVTAGMHAVLNMDWRKQCTKVCVLIADAPPHGLEPTGDGFPGGDPNGHDPLQIAREMAKRGIVLYTVGCEPALGQYARARGFFIAVAQLTGGQAVTLASSSLLADVILAGTAEEVALERLMADVQADMRAAGAFDAAVREDDAAQERAVAEVHRRLRDRGTRTVQMATDGRLEEDGVSRVLVQHESLLACTPILPAPAPSAPAPGRAHEHSMLAPADIIPAPGRAHEHSMPMPPDMAPPPVMLLTERPPPPSGGGLTGMFRRMLAPSAAPSAASAPVPEMGAAEASPAPPAAAASSATFVHRREDDITVEQVSRMMKRQWAKHA